MTHWPRYPVIYEMNTWVWLRELSQKYREQIHLGNVPTQEWDALGDLRIDAVWLMGVWERSPVGIRIARKNPNFLAESERALPDFNIEDVVGSPYCIHRYVVDQYLGGPEGLTVARHKLAKRDIRLILDFVPNHVAPDHPWIFEHPEYFIQGSKDDLARSPSEFFETGGNIFAHGRDPYFPPWPDVAQLNAFHPGLRKANIETVREIASQCDGMRCDMAMLVMDDVFERTCGLRAGARPDTEYWEEVIQEAHKKYPDVFFIAEAYWDKEWELQRQGFNFCYDKRLYDRLLHESAESVRLHLSADLSYQEKLVRFIENHDEPRAASIFSPKKERAAAITFSTLPGARLFHEGQFEGRKVKVPIFLGRRPVEQIDLALQSFYRKLLKAVDAAAFRDGQWQLCDRSGWPDNQSYLTLVAWCWKREMDRYLIVVNLSDRRSQGRVRLPWRELAGGSWRLTDFFAEKVYERDGNEMCGPGLYIDLEPWGFHFLRF